MSQDYIYDFGLTQNHKGLHKENRKQETIDDDIPNALKIRDEYTFCAHGILHTPPDSTFETNTNINWYLYTQELTQKTTAAATATRGARGANTRPTAAMKSYTSLALFQSTNENDSQGSH